MRGLRALIIPIFFISCETWEYADLNDLNYGNEQHRIEIYVEGGITTQYTTHVISLYKPSDYINKTEQQKITNAAVFITSGIDTFVFQVDTIDHNFKSLHKFKAEISKKYTLNVVYNNVLFMATDSVTKAGDFDFKDIPLPQKDDIDYCPYGGDECVTLLMARHSYGFSNSNFWRWETNELFSDTINYLSQGMEESYTHQFADIQGLFANIEYYFQVGFDWQPADTLIAIKFSVSEKYYNHLRAKFIETDWKEGVFSSIPGNIPTNFSQGGSGYFFASDALIKKIPLPLLLETNKQ